MDFYAPRAVVQPLAARGNESSDGARAPRAGRAQIDGAQGSHLDVRRVPLLLPLLSARRPQLVPSTAAVYVHRFYMCRTMQAYDYAVRPAPCWSELTRADPCSRSVLPGV